MNSDAVISPAVGDVRAGAGPALHSVGHALILAHRRALLSGLVVVLCAYHLVAIATYGIARVDGTRYYLVDDDVMISMSYGRNLARGNGLTYTPGERVEGFTNPLMTLLTAGLHLFPLPARVLPGVIMLFNIALSAAILFMLADLWGASANGRVAGLVSAGFYVLLPHHAWYAHAGYEVYMEMAILIYALRRITALRIGDAVVLGLLPLTHATALVMWALLVTASVLLSEHRRSALVPAAVAVIPFAVYEVFRIVYYGETLPNTYYLKAAAGTMAGGLRYAADWLSAIAPLVPLALYAVFRTFDRRRWLIVALLVAHTVSVVGLGGDILPQYRFLFPCSLLLVCLAGIGGSEWLAYGLHRHRSIAHGSWRWIPRAAALVLLVAAAGRVSVHSYHLDVPLYESQRKWNIRHIATGLAVNENTRPNDLIALFGLGFSGYFADRPTIDMLGKADYHVARMPPRRDRLIGHNKTDFDYVLSRNPDYVECTLSPERFADIEWLTMKQRTDPYGMTYDLALNPTFRQRYGPQITDPRRRKVGFYAPLDRPRQTWRIREEFYENEESGIER